MGGCVVCRYEWGCCYLYTSSFVYGSYSSHGWAVKAVIRKRGLKIEQLTGTSPAGLNASMWAFVYAFVRVCVCVCLCVMKQRVSLCVSPCASLFVSCVRRVRSCPLRPIKTLLQWHLHIRRGNCESDARVAVALLSPSSSSSLFTLKSVEQLSLCRVSTSQ